MPLLSDPIGDLLTRMRNAQHARRSTVRAPWSKIKEQICHLLKREGWIQSVAVIGDAPKQELEITFAADKSALTLTRISKPGRRAYAEASAIKPVLQGFGLAIISTSQGVITDAEARDKKIGGEVLCTVS